MQEKVIIWFAKMFVARLKSKSPEFYILFRKICFIIGTLFASVLVMIKTGHIENYSLFGGLMLADVVNAIGIGITGVFGATFLSSKDLCLTQEVEHCAPVGNPLVKISPPTMLNNLEHSQTLPIIVVHKNNNMLKIIKKFNILRADIKSALSTATTKADIQAIESEVKQFISTEEPELGVLCEKLLSDLAAAALTAIEG